MQRTRSPNFPRINLKRATELAQSFYSMAQRRPMSVEAVVKGIWEMSPTSGTAKQLIGALLAFGLIEVEESGRNRSIRISDEGAKILEGHPDRAKLLKRAALLPKVHKIVWENCVGADGLAPENTIQHYLLFEHAPPFNKTSIVPFIKQFEATVSFAKVASGGSIADESSHSDEEASPTGNGLSVTGREHAVDIHREQAGMSQNTLQLDEGRVIFEYPASISAESFEDLKVWLDLMATRVQRAVSTAKDDAEEPEAL